MNNRSDELEEHIKAEQQRAAVGQPTPNGDTEAALEALDGWDLRQYQEMGPPDVERAQELYRDGEVDEQEFEVLLESAMQYYPPDGQKENSMSLLEASDGDELRFAAKLIVALIIGFGLAACLHIITPPPAVPL